MRISPPSAFTKWDKEKPLRDVEGGDSREEAQFCDNHSANSVIVYD